MRGHIEERRSGVWKVQVSGGFSESSGRRIRMTQTVKGTRRDADVRLTAMLKDADDGLITEGGGTTLTRYLEDKWLPHVRTQVRLSTAERYASLCRIHIESRLGRRRLNKLRPDGIQVALNGMTADGFSAQTVRHAYVALSAALRQAVLWQIIPVNHAKGAKPPKVERNKKLAVPDASVVRALIEGAEEADGALHVGVVLAAYCGLRRGEVLGLRWSAVEGLNGDEPLLRIVETLQRAGGKLASASPKTDRSRRSVHLAASAAAVLRAWKKAQAERQIGLGAAWQGEGHVLDRGDGRPIEPAEFSHAFTKLRDNTEGAERVRLHDLRHAYATRLLEAGQHPKVVSEALGHSSTAFTMDTYQHVLPTMGVGVAAAIEAALAPTANG